MLPFISSFDLAAILDEEVTTQDLLTQIALDAACQLVRDDLQQEINLIRGDIEIYNGNGREILMLREFPVIDVASVTEDGVELVPDDDYVVDYRLGYLFRRRPYGWSYGWLLGWPRRRQNIEVVYDHGWAITEEEVVNEDSGDEPIVDRVPSGIRMVALEAAARIYRAPSTLAAAASATSSGVTTSETIGSYSYTSDASTVAEAASAVIARGLNEQERRALDSYRRPQA